MLFLLSSIGCAIQRPVVTLEPRPVLIHLPGVAGTTWFDDQFVRSLNIGGFDAEGQVYNWAKGRSILSALQDEPRNRAEAEILARKIVDMHRAEPNRPIYLTCESGGAGMAVFTLECLPDDVQVDAVLLLAPAVDPDYDLSKSLRHVRKNVLVFTSPKDRLILGAGTRLFGTMNGTRTEAAGKVGFTTPPAADIEQYEKLIVHEYDSKWLWRYGHTGDHADAVMTRFASGYIAPLLTGIALDGRVATQPSPG